MNTTYTHKVLETKEVNLIKIILENHNIGLLVFKGISKHIEIRYSRIETVVNAANRTMLNDISSRHRTAGQNSREMSFRRKLFRTEVKCAKVSPHFKGYELA